MRILAARWYLGGILLKAEKGNVCRQADLIQTLYSLRKSGAGEAIRTLDPNLGKAEIDTSQRSH